MILIDLAVLERITAARPDQAQVACRMCRIADRPEGLDLPEAIRVLLWLLLTKIQVPESRKIMICDVLEPYCHQAAEKAGKYLTDENEGLVESLPVYLAENRYLVTPDDVYDTKLGKPVKSGLPQPFFSNVWDLSVGCLMLVLEQTHQGQPSVTPPLETFP